MCWYALLAFRAWSPPNLEHPLLAAPAMRIELSRSFPSPFSPNHVDLASLDMVAESLHTAGVGVFSVPKYPPFMVQIGWIFLSLSSSVYYLKIIGNICLEILGTGSNIPTRNMVIGGI